MPFSLASFKLFLQLAHADQERLSMTQQQAQLFHKKNQTGGLTHRHSSTTPLDACPCHIWAQQCESLGTQEA